MSCWPAVPLGKICRRKFPISAIYKSHEELETPPPLFPELGKKFSTMVYLRACNFTNYGLSL